MTEAEAAMQIGQNIGEILVLVKWVPAVIAAPVVGLIGLGGFLFGKKYERKWNKKAQDVSVTKYENNDEVE